MLLKDNETVCYSFHSVKELRVFTFGENIDLTEEKKYPSKLEFELVTDLN